jgi:hypothetical protein
MWQQLDSGQVTHRFEWVILVATLAVIPVMVSSWRRRRALGVTLHSQPTG